MKLDVQTAAKSGRLVIEAEAIAKRFGERVIIRDFSTRIMRGDRIGIIGPNGAGKTTLIRLLTGDLAPDAGSVRLGTNLQIASIDQRRDQLDPSKSPWQTLCPDGGDQVEVQGRFRHVVGYLKDFLFRPEQLPADPAPLGGEQNRLLLAQQLARPANLLVMDEPTNDLDMDTLDLLEEMLADFDGTLLLVSHDRDFLDRLVTSTIVLEGDGKAMEFAGGYTDCRGQSATAGLTRGPAARETSAPDKPEAAASKPDHRKVGRMQRQAERERAKLERQMERLGADKTDLEAALADPDLFARDPAGFETKTATLARVQQELEQAEERWLDLELQAEAEAS
ncbi:MAG: ATP-binding cassette domain-containing protein [Alphaproteobacteria bacterium]